VSFLQEIESKIYSLNDIKNKVIEWKESNKKIVFTNGCFDLLHVGHITYLSKARDLGDILIVGINSDDSPYWKTKGDNRPINGQTARGLVLGSLFFVDAILYFSEDNPKELIKTILPDILVKGKDYNIEDISGYDVVIENGGEVKTIDIVDGYSTTNIINRL
jgi:rfaE bifunctional protein nucleotidyltransferase chain/domain